MPNEVVPVAVAKQPTTPTFNNLNYTNQDYYSLKNRLRDLLVAQYADRFNDFFESSLGIMLLEMWAFIADTINFKTDQIANELFIDTVTEVENIFRLARLVGLQPTPPIAASAMFSVSISQVLVADLAIPPGTQLPVSNDGTAMFYEVFACDNQNNPLYDDDIVIASGNLANTSAIGLEGQTIQDSFTGTGGAGQSFPLTEAPVLFDSVRVSVDGLRWQQVDHFSQGAPLREFRVEYDSAYNAFLIFGNSTAGLAPSNGSVIAAKYRVGGGTRGNIITGFINAQRNFVVPDLAFSLPVTFANYTPGQFGYDGDGVEEVRNKLPAWVTTQQRCVTGADYKVFVEQFVTPYHGQVGRATVALRNQGCAGNIVDVYVLAAATNSTPDLQLASDELKLSLSEQIEKQKMLTDHVCIRDGSIIATDVTLDIVVDKSYKKLLAELKAKAMNLVTAFFALGNWAFGDSLTASSLVKAMTTMREITTIDVTFTTDDPENSGDVVVARFDEIIRPDQVHMVIAFA